MTEIILSGNSDSVHYKGLDAFQADLLTPGGMSPRIFETSSGPNPRVVTSAAPEVVQAAPDVSLVQVERLMAAVGGSAVVMADSPR